MTNLNTYKTDIKNLRFKDTEIKLIEIQSVSVFVPINDEAVEVWELYVTTIENNELDIIDKKISLKKLASKISQYTFSLADYRNSVIKYLEEYGEKKYGYLYLKDWQAQTDEKILYFYENGLDTSVLKGEFVNMIL